MLCFKVPYVTVLTKYCLIRPGLVFIINFSIKLSGRALYKRSYSWSFNRMLKAQNNIFVAYETSTEEPSSSVCDL